MPTITNRGSDLADLLNPYMGTTLKILEICSLLKRHGVTVKRMGEIQCNGGEGSTNWMTCEQKNANVEHAEKREAQLLERMQALADKLPEPETADGDRPRGSWVVKCPSLWPILTHTGLARQRGGIGDDFGRRGWHLST